jgi:hypothetical protein
MDQILQNKNKQTLITVVITIIIIIIRNELGLDRPVSASSFSLLKGIARLLRQFGL